MKKTQVTNVHKQEFKELKELKKREAYSAKKQRKQDRRQAANERRISKKNEKSVAKKAKIAGQTVSEYKTQATLGVSPEIAKDVAIQKSKAQHEQMKHQASTSANKFKTAAGAAAVIAVADDVTGRDHLSVKSDYDGSTEAEKLQSGGF